MPRRVRKPQAPSNRRRAAASDPDTHRVTGFAHPFVRVAMSAWVDSQDSEPRMRLVSQEEFARGMGVSTQTARNWEARGLPVVRGDGGDGRPRYGPDAWLWAIVWVRMEREIQRRYGATMPGFLSMADVHHRNLEQQASAHPGDFVLVPLDWSHPTRKRQLALAVAGRCPAPLPPDFAEDDGEAAGAAIAAEADADDDG